MRSAHSRRGRGLLPAGLLAASLAAVPGTVRAQAVHVIRLEADPAHDIHRFVPARVTAKPGDVLLFRATSGTPHNVAFEGAGLSPAARDALNASMPARSGDLSGPVLSQDGAEYRIKVPALPPGRYGFFSIPHRAYEMRGELVVGK